MPEKQKAERQAKAQAGITRSRQYAEDAVRLAEKHPDLFRVSFVALPREGDAGGAHARDGDRTRAVELMKEAAAVPRAKDSFQLDWMGLRTRLVEVPAPRRETGIGRRVSGTIGGRLGADRTRLPRRRSPNPKRHHATELPRAESRR